MYELVLFIELTHIRICVTYVLFCTERKTMKHNKILATIAMAALLTLGACGGGNSGSKSSGNGGKSSGGSKTSTTSVPPAPVKGKQIDEIKLVTKTTDNKVYVQFKGSETLLTAADKIEYAFGISTDSAIPEAGEDGTISSENFVYGKAVPAATDFQQITFTPAADATKVEFSFEYCLTDIAGIKTGVYNFFGGFSADSYEPLEFVDANAEFMARDTKYDYFMRTDGNPNGLAIEDLGPFAVTEGSVVKLADADLPVKDPALTAGYYLKVGGTQAQAYTQEQLDAWNTKLDYQRMNGYTKFSSVDFFWKLEGAKVYLYMALANCISDLSADNPLRTYMIHCTADAPDPAPRGFNPGKLLPSVDILTNNVFSFADDNVKITVIGDTSKGQNDGEDHFYGALGVQVEYINAPEPVAAE